MRRRQRRSFLISFFSLHFPRSVPLLLSSYPLLNCWGCYIHCRLRLSTAISHISTSRSYCRIALNTLSPERASRACTNQAPQFKSHIPWVNTYATMPSTSLLDRQHKLTPRTQDAPSGPPPNYSAPANHSGGGEAASYYGNSSSAPAAPQNSYYPPQQGYSSPAPDPNRGFMPPQQGYPPQQGGYPPQGYPPQGGQPMYYQQQGYPPPQGYVQQESAAGGICAGVLSALACCCCLDILF
jgi:hypothetical protein